MLKFHPKQGTVLFSKFDGGFREPEMVKSRPVVVLSKEMATRPKLCTVVALSATASTPAMPYHLRLSLPVPKGVGLRPDCWVKGDMIYALSFDRLSLYRVGGRGDGGRRTYWGRPLDADIFRQIQRAVLHGLGLSNLTKSL
ncbi:MAG: type II toxin-antitoxin system PemK/MazF family toxin [Pseudomonadota bacterium]